MNTDGNSFVNYRFYHYYNLLILRSGKLILKLHEKLRVHRKFKQTAPKLAMRHFSVRIEIADIFISFHYDRCDIFLQKKFKITHIHALLFVVDKLHFSL